MSWTLSNPRLNSSLYRAVNFIFLVEAGFQDGGLHGEVNDDIWDSLCDALKDPISPLANEVLTEAHQWSHQLANNKFEKLGQLLEESPPNDRTLKSILTKMVGAGQHWGSSALNEDTYLKSRLGPFQDPAYNSHW